MLGRSPLRTKLLVFPALAVVLVGVVSWAALDILASHKRLLDQLSGQHLAKTRELMTLHLRLSQNHAAIYDLLSEARGLEEEAVYERGYPILDAVRAIEANVSALPQAWSLTPAEAKLSRELAHLLEAYLQNAITSVDRARWAPQVADQFIAQANEHYRRVNRVFGALVEESRQGTGRAIAGVVSETAEKLRWLTGLVFMAVLAGVGLSLVFARLLTRPLLALTRVVEHVRQTNGYDLRAPRQSSDEVGDLVDGFNAMLAQIQRREEELHVARVAAEGEAARVEHVLTSIAWILVAVDEAGTVTQWNAAAEATFGIPAAQTIGRAFTDTGIRWDWGAVMAWVEAAQAGERAATLEAVSCPRSDGRPGVLTLTLSPIRRGAGSVEGFLLLGSDVTDRKNLEGQLARSQKLESLGQLAAGVAHEINTPIQFVGDNVRFLRDAFGDLQGVMTACRDVGEAAAAGPVDAQRLERMGQAMAEADMDYLLGEVPQAIEQSLDGVGRVAKIVRALKDFAHPSRGEKIATDLNQSLLNTLTVARNEVKYVAEVETDFEDLPPVVCYPDDLNQVFLNLLVNAAHAIEEVQRTSGGRGLIRIRTARDGDSVVVSVSDTGSGIPPEIRDRIFDPFFTTKPVGKGTGQGLAIAHSVVTEKHGGTLTFETEVGRGTVFFIRLPIGDVSEALRDLAIAE